MEDSQETPQRYMVLALMGSVIDTSALCSFSAGNTTCWLVISHLSWKLFHSGLYFLGDVAKLTTVEYIDLVLEFE